MPGRIKPWMKQPGELHDCRGVPIYPGDLLRSYHFTGKRGKTHYLYHIAVMCKGAMRGISNSDIEYFPLVLSGTPGFLLSQQQIFDGETVVIDGHGPGDFLSHEDRPKVKLETANA